ncbi:glycine cleavage H-protein-domain-containing protein [Plectosphaerella plurivora]|uniref:Glycine cleavage system H protein n=1 Tax=Plectosphaerella plurivora TaxID=936078 RepID=A0A9P8VLH5_9PEZI|nr:glycine cleavage H-protein-domain-containing protein [Plectosphaerella plurivora]
MASLLIRSTLRVAPRRAAVALAPRVSAPVLQTRAFSWSSPSFVKKYTESHEWVEVAEDGKTCTVGISKYAADALGDVVYIELPAEGDEATASEAFGTVESVKSASDIVSPVSGIIIVVNEALAEKPADLSKDPEESGWLVKIESTDATAADALMDEKAYAEYLEGL